MQIKHERCAGIDVHKKTVVVCCLRVDASGNAQRETRTYGTTTRELLSLCDWLAQSEVTQIAIGLYRGVLEAGVQRVREQL
jgi:hypothetical protein